MARSSENLPASRDELERRATAEHRARRRAEMAGTAMHGDGGAVSGEDTIPTAEEIAHAENIFAEFPAGEIARASLANAAEAEKIAVAKPSDVMLAAFANAKPLNGKNKNGNGNGNERAAPIAEPPSSVQELVIPPEAELRKEGTQGFDGNIMMGKTLASLMPEQLAPEEQKLYAKLPKGRQEDYLVHVAELRAEEERKIAEKGQRKARDEQKERRVEEEASKPKRRKRPSREVRVARKSIRESGLDFDLSEPVVSEPEPFDPHSVPSMLSVAEQQEELRQGAGARVADVDINHVYAPQYGQGKSVHEHMAEDMSALSGYVSMPGSESSPKADTEPAVSRSEPPEKITQEGTPKEWREKLRGLVMDAEGTTKEKLNLEGQLRQRSRELDIQAEKIGGVEKLFRSLGTTYNKLGWKSKLLMGASLVLGAAASLSFMFPAALAACTAGLVTQRAAGLSSLYLKFQKNSPGTRWGKEKSLLKAAGLSAFMTAGTLYAVKEISETMQEWLGKMLGHEPKFPVQTPTPPEASVVPEPLPPLSEFTAEGQYAGMTAELPLSMAVAESPRAEAEPVLEQPSLEEVPVSTQESIPTVEANDTYESVPQSANVEHASTPQEIEAAFKIDPARDPIFKTKDGTIVAYSETLGQSALFDLAQEYAKNHPGTVVRIQAEAIIDSTTNAAPKPWMHELKWEKGGGIKVLNAIGPTSPDQVGSIVSGSFVGQLDIHKK